MKAARIDGNVRYEPDETSPHLVAVAAAQMGLLTEL